MKTNNIESTSDGHRWEIDRRVPLALIYLLVAQFIGAILFFGNLMAQVSAQDKRITFIEGQKVSERLVTLESQMVDTKGLLMRMDGNLMRLVERGANVNSPRNP